VFFLTRTFEHPPADRSHGARPKARKALDRPFTHLLGTLTTLLGESADRKKDVDRSARRAKGASAFEQPHLLDVCIVEVAEHPLQPLQRVEDVREVASVVDRCRDIDKISQLLGIDTHFMEAFSGYI
jgi:hypothetical protein